MSCRGTGRGWGWVLVEYGFLLRRSRCCLAIVDLMLLWWRELGVARPWGSAWFGLIDSREDEDSDGARSVGSDSCGFSKNTRRWCLDGGVATMLRELGWIWCLAGTSTDRCSSSSGSIWVAWLSPWYAQMLGDKGSLLEEWWQRSFRWWFFFVFCVGFSSYFQGGMKREKRVMGWAACGRNGGEENFFLRFFFYAVFVDSVLFLHGLHRFI